MAKSTIKDPIINCHTHIFTGDHVPPYLAKSFVWPPMYVLFHLPTVLSIFKYILRIIHQSKYRPTSLYNRTNRILYTINKKLLTKLLLSLVILWLSINALFILLDWISAVIPITGMLDNFIDKAIKLLTDLRLILLDSHWLLKLAIVLFVLSFVKIARNFIFFILKNIWKFLNLIPGRNTKELLQRYVLLGRYTLYKNQAGILSKLRNQYPHGSRFIVLPMDMEYMRAGKLKSTGVYKEQMAELVKIKKRVSGEFVEPFVFIDPRRIKEQIGFLDYSVKDGKVKLEKCDIKDYLEKYGFSGFKIYPALGYYPFDKDLLPLWKYAADNGYPIMTHCIHGTIFYRGGKLREWDEHPIFLEYHGKGKTRPLSLPQKKNIDFSTNFTNPLNYLCLLSEPLLRKVVGNTEDTKIMQLFGYIDENTPLKYNLRHLKICMAHFGGEEEWVRYLEADRNSFAQRLIRERSSGLDFTTEGNVSLRWGVLEQIWKSVDWYSIICSLILQFPNVYADISYLLSKPRIMPLLRETLDGDLNPHLRTRILFGTDFYVVRNHFSEKDLCAQITAELSEGDFDLIARENPQIYLRKANSKL